MSSVKTLPIIAADEWLQPVEEQIVERHNRYLSHLQNIENNCSSIVDYANGYKYFGWQYDDMMCGWGRNIQRFACRGTEGNPRYFDRA